MFIVLGTLWVLDTYGAPTFYVCAALYATYKFKVGGNKV